MVSHTPLTVAATVTTVLAVALTLQVRAGADKVAFPDNYSTGVMYLSIDKAESKQVHQVYGMPEAFAAARKDQPMPRGRYSQSCGTRRSSMLRAIPLEGLTGNSLKASFWATL